MRTFVERFALEQRLAAPLSVSSGAMALLTAYDWPGNIRQLENAIFRAVVLAEGAELTVKDFPQIATQIPGYVVAEKSGFSWEETGPSKIAGGRCRVTCRRSTRISPPADKADARNAGCG